MAWVPDHRIATLVAGVVTLAAGAVLVSIAPRSRLHRATGLFFGLRGAMLTLTAFSNPRDDLQGRLLVYALLALPFAAAWMAYRFSHDVGPRRAARNERLWAGLLLGATATLALVYAFDHEVFFGDSLGGFLVYLFDLQFLVYAGLAWALRLEHDRRPEGPSRRALFVLVVGLAAEPTFYAVRGLLAHLVPDQGSPAPTVAILALTLVACVLSIPWRATGHERNRASGILGLAALTGLLVYLNARNGVLTSQVFQLPTANAAWTVFTIAAVAYASLRYRLFGMDLRVKMFLRYGSTTFLLALVFFVASEVIEANLDTSTTGQSLALAALVAAALFPLHHLTKRLVERWMPGVANTEEYRRRRRQDIYVAALERARTDGLIDESERQALRMLGHGLGLSGKDMAFLEKFSASS